MSASQNMENLTQDLRLMIGNLHEDLRSIKEALQPEGDLIDKRFWGMTILVKPGLNRIHETVVALSEESRVFGTWDGLDDWVNACSQTLCEQLARNGALFEMLGVQSCEQLSHHPMAKEASRNYGPNWQASPQEIGRVTGFTSSKGEHPIPVESMEKCFCVRMRKIREDWECLRSMKETGELNKFWAKWSQISQSARRRYLQDNFDYLHDSPDPYVYQIETFQTSEWSSIPAKQFKAPMLNVPELVDGDNLPNLIKSRLDHSPELFRHIDGNGSVAGLFCGSLKADMAIAQFVSCTGNV